MFIYFAGKTERSPIHLSAQQLWDLELWRRGNDFSVIGWPWQPCVCVSPRSEVDWCRRTRNLQLGDLSFEFTLVSLKISKDLVGKITE